MVRPAMRERVTQRTEESTPARRPQPAPAAELPELDRMIHERMRLGIVSALATNDSLSFNDLKRLLKTTDANLGVHARKLEDADYVRCNKFFEGRVPDGISPDASRPQGARGLPQADGRVHPDHAGAVGSYSPAKRYSPANKQRRPLPEIRCQAVASGSGKTLL